jgi:hypothetical protein
MSSVSEGYISILVSTSILLGSVAMILVTICDSEEKQKI